MQCLSANSDRYRPNFSYYHSLINNVGHENERNEQQTQNV